MGAARPAGGGMLRTFRWLLVVLVCLSSASTAVYAGASVGTALVVGLAGLGFGLAVVVLALPKPSERQPDPRLRWDE